MDLLTRLDKLGLEINKKVPYINYGGCCVFAAFVTKELIALRLLARGIVSSHNAMDYGTSRLFSIDDIRLHVKEGKIHEWQNNGLSFAHVGVEFRYKDKWWHYDSNGVHRKEKELDSMPIYNGRLFLREMEILAGSKYGWNDTFDRRSIPKVLGLVKKHMQDISL